MLLRPSVLASVADKKCAKCSLICIFGYVKTNIVTYRIHSDAQLVSLCLTGTLSSNKSDSTCWPPLFPQTFSCLDCTCQNTMDARKC